MTTLAKLAVLLLLPLLAEKEPPSPEERVAEMKAECAEEREDLARWAERKDLEKAALAHYRIALNLDPDARKAKRRLDDEDREWTDGRGAWEEDGEELQEKERELTRAEAAAFAKLGLELVEEGRADLGRPLCLRAHFLDPSREDAAKGIGLVPFAKGFARPEIAEALRKIPQAEEAAVGGLLERTLSTKTVVRQCVSCIAETVGEQTAADEIARTLHQGQVLASMRFGLPPAGKGWVTASVAKGRAQYDALVDRIGFGERGIAISKAIGNFRLFQPRHCLASFVGEVGDPRNRIPLFLHYVGENVLWWHGGRGVPAWLDEAAGLDVNLTLVGRPGPTCVTWEESGGLTNRERFDEHAHWPPLLVRRAALEDLPRMELLLRAQIQALGPEDILASHAYLRWLRIERGGKLADYLRNLSEEQAPEPAFEGAFGMTAEELTRALAALLTDA